MGGEGDGRLRVQAPTRPNNSLQRMFPFFDFFSRGTLVTLGRDFFVVCVTPCARNRVCISQVRLNLTTVSDDPRVAVLRRVSCLCHVAVSEVFLAGDIAECHFHPQEARFPWEAGASSSGGNWDAACAGAESALGYYPCCGKPACRYDCTGGQTKH